MKNAFIIIILLSTLSCKSRKGIVYKVPLSKSYNIWTMDMANTYAKSRNDSSKWNREMLETDIKNTPVNTNDPIYPGAFPVPEYKTPGVSANGYELNFNNKHLFVFSYGVHTVKLDTLNKKPTYAVFLNVAVLIDKNFDVKKDYKKIANRIISRNHPHYVAEGRFETSKGNVDWIGLLAANGDTYAIVNMRLFDLKVGNTIFIAPQKDKSFRSLQINGPLQTSKSISNYIDQLLLKKDVGSFLNAPGNID